MASLASDALPNGPLVRQVRIGAMVNGQQIAGPAVTKFTVNNEGTFSASTWSASIALNGMPSGYGSPYWAEQPSVEVTLLASLSIGGTLVPVIGGMVDTADVDLDQQCIEISGRDYLASMIDNISTDKFTNQTSSQIINTFAQRRGLVPQITPTSTQVGRYFNEQNDYMAEDASEWRLASFLAQQEGFDLFANGKTLVFQPSAMDPSPLIVNYTYRTASAPISANVTRIKLRQRKNLAGNATVQVRSWQHQTKTPILSTWQSQKTQSPASNTGAPSTPQVTQSRNETQSGITPNGPFYIERRSGLTQAQADQLGQKMLSDVCSHEREVTIEGPGVIGIDARRTVRLVGTKTAFDQDYEIKSIERTFSWDGGCKMTKIGRAHV